MDQFLNGGANPPLKQCSKCKQPFPATTEFFSKDKSRKDGLKYVCRICSSGEAKDYYDTHRDQKKQYGQDNKLRISENNKIRSQDNKQQKSEYMKDYYLKNKEVIAERDRVYREENRPKIAKRNRDYRKNNPILMANQDRRRRAREKHASGFHTEEDVKILLKNSKGLCWWCGEKIVGTPHIDHRVALAKGGSNAANNLCVSCAHCNLSKNTKLPYEFNGRLL